MMNKNTFMSFQIQNFLLERTTISDLQTRWDSHWGETKKAVDKVADIYLRWNKEDKIIRTNL